MAFLVVLHPEALIELGNLPVAEKVRLYSAFEKLEALGTQLRFPHQSAVKGGGGLRELRPGAGRAPWRALYRQMGESIVILAIAPEAMISRKGFAAAMTRAHRRFAAIEQGDSLR